jgi:hypothetical protein
MHTPQEAPNRILDSNSYHAMPFHAVRQVPYTSFIMTTISIGVKDDGSDVFARGANTWISSMDVVASGPGRATWCPVTSTNLSMPRALSSWRRASIGAPIKFNKFKSEKVKLQLSKSKKDESGFKVAVTSRNLSTPRALSSWKTPIKFNKFTSEKVKLLSKSKKDESGFKVAESDPETDKSTLIWEPTTAGDTLTIRCMRGTYIPAFPATA